MPAPDGLPVVTATRYVTPLKEGGSLPGIVEASDDGTYVLKFRGAGQGLKVLVAEIVVAGLAALIDVPVPALAVVDLDARIAKYEADEEVQDLLTASLGTNLGVDYLPGSLGYDGSRPPPADLAERIIWLDALTANVDRTWSNPNLLVWHGRTWAIDHGAALYFHHSWPSRAPSPERFAAQPFDASKHVLRQVAGDVSARHGELAERVTPDAVSAVVDSVPAEWLEPTAALPDAVAVRTAYRDLLAARLSGPAAWLPGAAS
ncbi:MAG: aminotransferase class I and II [Humibacillus sp.]|nr:aminotransferase class I and II [Humibacillus sp.]MDN5776016.1 aminotransferase class I and II [Humibacillus sp.]